MKYKLLAPVRTRFAIRSEAPIRDAGGYTTFWNTAAGGETVHKLRRRLAENLHLSQELQEIRFAHSSGYLQSRFNRYTSLRSDSLERPLHVLEIALDGQAVAPIGMIESPLQERLESVIWRLYDHNVGLLEIDIRLGNDLAGASNNHDIRDALDVLQETGIRLTEQLVRWSADELFQPIFEELCSLEGSGDYLELRIDADANHADSAILWVTRTLILEPDDDRNRDRVVTEWLRDTVYLAEANGSEEVARVARDSTAHLTKWLNYLFREHSYPSPSEAPPTSNSSSREAVPALARPFCDVWEAMLYAQFFYGALDLVDGRLTSILAESLARDQTLSVSALKARLERNIDKANLLLLQRHDSSKYYRRTVKSKLDEILDGWDFETVLVEPVQRKIDICQERLALLHQKDVARSGIYTDLILISIGITSIFGMSLALAEYGRTMANDPDLASYDVTSAYAIDWFAALPTDIILTWSGILSLALVGIYFYYRRRQID